MKIVVGVLALQGAFVEHEQRLRLIVNDFAQHRIEVREVRTKEQLAECDALVIPGGESTSMSLVAERSGLLEPLREFVKVKRRPTWGTCAGLILLAEQANRTKKGGQELIGGLDIRVIRNHFGRQTESFETNLELPFIEHAEIPFHAIFIRAPIVESILPNTPSTGSDEQMTAPSRKPQGEAEASLLSNKVEILAQLSDHVTDKVGEVGGPNVRAVAVRQGNVVGTSFHPELSEDLRLHRWWLEKNVFPALSKLRMEH